MIYREGSRWRRKGVVEIEAAKASDFNQPQQSSTENNRVHHGEHLVPNRIFADIEIY